MHILFWLLVAAAVFCVQIAMKSESKKINKRH